MLSEDGCDPADRDHDPLRAVVQLVEQLVDPLVQEKGPQENLQLLPLGGQKRGAGRGVQVCRELPINQI